MFSHSENKIKSTEISVVRDNISKTIKFKFDMHKFKIE